MWLTSDIGAYTFINGWPNIYHKRAFSDGWPNRYISISMQYISWTIPNIIHYYQYSLSHASSSHQCSNYLQATLMINVTMHPKHCLTEVIYTSTDYIRIYSLLKLRILFFDLIRTIIFQPCHSLMEYSRKLELCNIAAMHTIHSLFVHTFKPHTIVYKMMTVATNDLEPGTT